MRDAALEFLVFGLKQIRACVFVAVVFAAVFLMPRAGVCGVSRYDLLLIVALAIQGAMLWAKLETLDELQAVCLFHALGFGLEVFKTSQGIKSWSYPDAGLTKLWGVPLFSGFMYSAVGSYITQAWRVFELRVRHHPPYWMAWLIAGAIYANFFTHHYIGDFRWYLAACTLGLYARTTVCFRPLQRQRRMPLLLSFVLLGFFIWLAENIGTFFGVWRYPNQIGAWATVNIGKCSSWSLLVIMTCTIVANLKHIKAHIYIPE
jgi:uncharacterized membrane protein YoaT (DUF817 family)